jgi:murein DD-endopeptidase MepM/ murein hydrolase activator NlpD
MRKEFKQFLKAWGNWWFWRLYRGFAGFEKVKSFVAQGLYKQRGRLARPFMHTAMGGLVAMSITLAPVLASNLPASDAAGKNELPMSSGLVAVSDNGTSTQVSDKVRDKVLDYEVQGGDTVSGIAAKFGVSADTIRWENDLTSVNQIKPGQTLRILPVSGVLHKVARGENVYSIAKKYEANAQAIVDFPFNTFSDNETFALAVGQDLIVPDGKMPNVQPWSPSLYVAQRTPSAGAVSATGNFAWPIGGVITQRFAWYHRAVDIATSLGTPIVAADAGRVVVAGWPDNSGYGNRVEINHGNGFVTLYGHMSRIDVVVGQTVNRGDKIGLEGSTGRSTGPHLHFEIRQNGALVNPLGFLK